MTQTLRVNTLEGVMEVSGFRCQEKETENPVASSQ